MGINFLLLFQIVTFLYFILDYLIIHKYNIFFYINIDIMVSILTILPLPYLFYLNKQEYKDKK